MSPIKKRIIYLMFCLFVGGSAYAQDKSSYFVYIQNEKSQPFYLKYKGKVLSSSPKGYIILPKIEQGESIPVTVGFPKNEYPEQTFLLKVNRRDQGLLLKNTGEKDFALYDLQTFGVTRAGEGLVVKEKEPAKTEEVATAATMDSATETTATESTGTVATEEPKKADPAPARAKGKFASALDRVVVDGRDEAIPEEKPEMVAAPVKEEAAPVAPAEKLTKKQQRKNRKKNNTLSEEEQALLASVLEEERKVAEQEATEDAAAKAKEEPVKTEEVKAEEVKTEEVKPEEPIVKKEKKPAKKKSAKDPDFIEFGAEGAQATTTAAADEVVKPSAKELRKQKRREVREARAAEEIDSVVQVTEEVPAVVEETSKKKKEEADRIGNSDCVKTLEVADFRKLMRKMSGEKNEDAMLDAFRKGIRGVCVSTEQVRSLVQLLDEEPNRYQLLDMAYPRTYDAENFSTLSGVLKQDYYQERFKAMLRKK